MIARSSKAGTVRATLPQDAESPTVLKLDPTQLPVLGLAFTGPLPLNELREIATALGLKIVRVLSVTEAERGIRPIVMAQRGAQMEALTAAPTPVESGTIEVRSSVTLTGELGPK